MSRSEKKRRNVLAVIEMFASLSLPVCDDEEAIRAKRNEQREARNRELNSTKGSVAARAQVWFEDVDALLNHREKLLTVVFEEFCGLADTSLRAGLDGGRNELGADTLIALRDVAMSWCRARSDLANTWLERFQELRGLKTGEPVDSAEAVEELSAKARGARVTLRWKASADGVRIVRAPEPSTGKADEVVVYEGSDSGFVDTEISAGQHYEYRVYTLHNGHPSLRAAHISTRRTRRPLRLGKPLAAAALLGLAGLGGWDLQREDSWIRAQLPEPTAAAATELHVGTDLETPPATTGEDVEAAQQLAERLAEGEHASLEDATPIELPPEVEELPPGPPPTASVLNAPSLAFSGQTLLIELDIDRPLEAELVEPVLRGVRLRGLELDRSPGVVRLYVDDLPEGKLEGEAAWSFRLADSQGLETTSITGRCLVLRSSED